MLCIEVGFYLIPRDREGRCPSICWGCHVNEEWSCARRERYACALRFSCCAIPPRKFSKVCVKSRKFCRKIEKFVTFIKIRVIACERRRKQERNRKCRELWCWLQMYTSSNKSLGSTCNYFIQFVCIF